jgi:hypothetical protein
MSMGNHGEMTWTEGNSWCVHQSSQTILPASHLVANRMDWQKEWEICLAQYLCSYSASDFLTRRKILRRGDPGFTSLPKECVLWIFIALKIPSPRPGLKSGILGLMASTITITPPRRLSGVIRQHRTHRLRRRKRSIKQRGHRPYAMDEFTWRHQRPTAQQTNRDKRRTAIS